MTWIYTKYSSDDVKDMKLRGVKNVCSRTRNLGRYMGDNIQVFYDFEEREVFGIYHIINEWTVFRNNQDIVYITTYYEPATQKEIENDVREALYETLKSREEEKEIFNLK